MTINGLWDYIKKNHPDVLEVVPQKSLRGRRIAIDAYNVFYIMRSIIRRRLIYSRDVIVNPLKEWDGIEDVPENMRINEVDTPWIKSIFDYVFPWLGDGITPVFVLDGPHMPEKAKTHEKRKLERDKSKMKLNDLLVVAEADLRNPYAQRDRKSLLEDIRKAMCGSGMTSLPKRSVKLAEQFLKDLGIPVVEAYGDGEQLCSTLCRCGIAAAVFSSDGDNLAHGCPILIRDKCDNIYTRDPNTGVQYGVPAFSIIRMHRLLEALEMNQKMFTDWCIMAGCDYNSNMPQIAIVKSLKLIREFGSIDYLPGNYNTSCLIHVRCRELFTPTENVKSLMSSGNIDIQPWDANVAMEALQTHGMTDHYQRIASTMSAIPKAVDFKHNFYNPPLYLDESHLDTLEGIVASGEPPKKKAPSRKKTEDLQTRAMAMQMGAMNLGPAPMGYPVPYRNVGMANSQPLQLTLPGVNYYQNTYTQPAQTVQQVQPAQTIQSNYQYNYPVQQQPVQQPQIQGLFGIQTSAQSQQQPAQQQPQIQGVFGLHAPVQSHQQTWQQPVPTQGIFGMQAPVQTQPQTQNPPLYGLSYQTQTQPQVQTQFQPPVQTHAPPNPQTFLNVKPAPAPVVQPKALPAATQVYPLRQAVPAFVNNKPAPIHAPAPAAQPQQLKLGLFGARKPKVNVTYVKHKHYEPVKWDSHILVLPDKPQ